MRITPNYAKLRQITVNYGNFGTSPSREVLLEPSFAIQAFV
jgi:hypothetical protein